MIDWAPQYGTTAYGKRTMESKDLKRGDPDVGFWSRERVEFHQLFRHIRLRAELAPEMRVKISPLLWI